MSKKALLKQLKQKDILIAGLRAKVAEISYALMLATAALETELAGKVEGEYIPELDDDCAFDED